MFLANPTPQMVSPSESTKLFGGKSGKILTKLEGSDINNLVVNTQTSASGSDHYYNAYHVSADSGVYGVMTPYVNPFLLIEMVDSPGKRYAVYEPLNVSFNGDTIWHYLLGSEDSLSDFALSDMLIQSEWKDADNRIKNYVASDILSENGYFTTQIGQIGSDSLKIVYTNYLEDAYVPFGAANCFQYPWDKADWKTANSADIEQHNINVLSAPRQWNHYVPETEVWHGVAGAKYSFYADIRPVDPVGTGKASGPAMTFYPTGDGTNRVKPFRGYFFYPILYVDADNTGVFQRVRPDSSMPQDFGTNYRTYRSSGTGYSLAQQILSGAETKYFGTPVWEMTFADDCPFSASIDPDRRYFVSLANDGSPLTVTISNANTAAQTYYNRPRITNNVLMWSEAQSDFDDGTLGKDTRVETFLSAGLEHTRFGSTGNRFTFGPLVFRSTQYNAYYKTPSCPQRGSSTTATEWVATPDTPYKGGSITLTWYNNFLNPVTNYYLEDIENIQKQPILDGADMTTGVFQVLESRVDWNTT